MAETYFDKISSQIKTGNEPFRWYRKRIKESIANCTFQPPFSMDMVPEETKMAMGWL